MIMKEEDVKTMWDIDSKLVCGDPISEEEIIFYNKHHTQMVLKMQENADHWKYHTSIV